MMRTIAIALMLGACAPVAAPVTADAGCRADAASALLGRPFTAALSADALKRTGAATVRVIRPGTAVTMDYRADRLNIELDAQGVVTRFGCS